MKVITSVEEFLETLKPGDSFWHMTSWYGEPWDIQGPFVIERIDPDYMLGERKSPKVFPSESSPALVKTENEETRRSGYMGKLFVGYAWRHSQQGMFVSSLASPHHGVFLSEEDAQACLAERKLAFQNDPKAIAERDRWKMQSEEEDRYWDEQFSDEPLDYDLADSSEEDEYVQDYED